MEDTKQQNRYLAIIENLFFSRYKKGSTEMKFERDELVSTANKLGVKLPKNLGDVIYSIRYRVPFPKKITDTQPDGKEWVIEGRGRAMYAFKLVTVNRIVPNDQLAAIKIPEATPEIITAYALSDEQALLAKVRYNRLLDIFMGITTYSLQSHLRTSVAGLGQVEIDELYVGVDKKGQQYIIPVQAKGGSDQLSAVQTRQDMACCTEKFPNLSCRPVSAQFAKEDLIALFELVATDGEVKILEEKHYRLVPSDQITAEDLKQYAKR
jgi:hypothetical protein